MPFKSRLIFTLGNIVLLTACGGEPVHVPVTPTPEETAQAEADRQLCSDISGRQYSSKLFQVEQSAFGNLTGHMRINFDNGAAVFQMIDSSASNNAAKIHFEAENQDFTGEAMDNAVSLRSASNQLNVSFDIQSAGEYQIVVHAGEEAAGPDHALMAVSLDGNLVETTAVSAPSNAMKNYTTDLMLTKAAHKLTFEFTNDYYLDGADRNLSVDWVEIVAKNGTGAAAVSYTGSYSCTMGKVNLQLPEREILPITTSNDLKEIYFDALGSGELTFEQQSEPQPNQTCKLVQGKRYANTAFTANDSPANLTLGLWFDKDSANVKVDWPGQTVDGYLDCDTDELHVHSGAATSAPLVINAIADGNSLNVSSGNNTFDLALYNPGPGTEGDGDFTIGPNYTNSPDLNDTNVPKGKLYEFFMPSSESAIYRGDDSTLNRQQSFNRRVRVYVPQQYVNGTKAPLIVAQDGYNGDLAKALNVLIERKSVPPIVVIFVDNGGGDSLGSQRGLEYDTVSDRYSRFITTEVLPKVETLGAIRADYPDFALTKDPDGRGTYGCSSGGAAAFTMGWFTPDQFRRIITYSGTFVDQQDTDAAEEREYPWGAWEYHERLIRDNPAKPLRVFLHVSENDNDRNLAENTHHNWVIANQHMARELGAKDYHYRFIYSLGAGHCDGKVIRQTLPETVKWMWQDYLQKEQNPFSAAN